ncbi:MAG: hypothetical protein GX791_04215 [Synergistaceae bacterium]|nr:hypothetical protein [Synergistaceae bacterium]
MKKVRTVYLLVILIIAGAAGLFFIQAALKQASAPPAPSRTPVLETAPVRLYGLVEPLGREVFVAPQQARRVEKIFVEEGQPVTTGQELCELEQAVERQSLETALLKVKELEGKLNILNDELKRKMPLPGKGTKQEVLERAALQVRELETRLEQVNDFVTRYKPLSKTKAVAEVEYSQKLLESEVVRRQIATARSQAILEYRQKSLETALLGRQIQTARAEAEMRRRELDILTLRSPIHGHLYKFDLRLGEQFLPQDYRRIVIGREEKQVRLFVEAFWLDKVKVGDIFMLRDADTGSTAGSGRVASISEYVGARDFRTEDALERLDTKYAQAVLHLKGTTSLPLGKLVLCIKNGEPAKDEKGEKDGH